LFCRWLGITVHAWIIAEGLSPDDPLLILRSNIIGMRAGIPQCQEGALIHPGDGHDHPVASQLEGRNVVFQRKLVGQAAVNGQLPGMAGLDTVFPA